jgi:hypothetical protein
MQFRASLDPPYRPVHFFGFGRKGTEEGGKTGDGAKAGGRDFGVRKPGGNTGEGAKAGGASFWTRGGGNLGEEE